MNDEDFDYIIFGTGLTESIIGASLVMNDRLANQWRWMKRNAFSWTYLINMVEPYAILTLKNILNTVSEKKEKYVKLICVYFYSKIINWEWEPPVIRYQWTRKAQGIGTQLPKFPFVSYSSFSKKGWSPWIVQGLR